MTLHRFNAYAAPARVDREKHVIFGVSALQAVEALGHRLMVDHKSLQQFADLGNAARNGLKSRFTHPGLSADGLGKHLGRMRDFRVVGDKVLGDLYLSETAARSPHGDLRAYVESLADEDPEAFGMSVVVDGYGAWQLADGTEQADDGNGRPTTATGKYPALRVVAAHAVDAVDEPAANRDGLFGAFSRTTNELAAAVYDILDRYPALDFGAFFENGAIPAAFQPLADEYDIDADKARIFAAQYLAHRERHAAPTRITLAATAATSHMESDPMEPEIQPGAAQNQPAAPNPPAANEWLAELSRSTAAAMIQGSGLPAPVQGRLQRGRYDNPAAVSAAIDEARAELAAMQEAQTVQLGNRPPRGQFHVSDALEDAAGMVEYFFGVPDAAVPPSNMRRFSDLYVALTGDEEFRGLFDPTRLMFAAATTATLSNLAADAMNKVIVNKMAVLNRWYEQIVEVVPNNGTLHDVNLITVGGIGTLPTVAEGASYPELPIDDTNETAEFIKKGGYVGITREAIKNSDILQLQAIPRALASAAIRTRSKAVAALFTMNSGVGPTLATDSKALFHTDHGNVATTAFGTDATAWRAARLAMFKQTELGSSAYMGVYPRYLLIPADLYDVALTVLGYGEGQPTSYVPEARDRGVYDPRPVPIVVPEWTDATDWAYIVDPNIWPVIHMSYSQAPGGGRHPAPELFSVTSETSGLMFTNDVLPIKVRDEFAVGVSGYQGIGKRNVAG